MTSPSYSRQTARAEKRSIFKQLRALRKEAAMKERRPGGAAATS